MLDLSQPREFRRAFEEHHRSVYATAFRILRVWRRPEAFNPRRGELGSYLRLMARSRALDLWREAQAAGRASDRMKLVVADDPERPEDVIERTSARGAVRDALRRLPDAQREALVLAYWGGLTADEIARRSAVPLGTAKSRIRLGLARLHSELAAV
jgi:RNA polymerase sigma-70 factor (ECF subfamily)